MEKDFDAIDKMARDALNDLEVKFNPNDWDRMQDKLDGVDQIDNTFREALQSFSVAFNPSDWSQMENTLDEIYVDQTIKNTLEGVEVPLNPSHWAMMENTLDKIYVDQPVKDSIQNFEAAFNPEDWAKMEEQLDRKKHLYPHIWLYKSIEAVVMGLILFTLFNFITKPSNPNYYKANSTTKKNSAVVLNSSNNNLEENNISEEFQTTNTAQNTNAQSSDKNILANNTEHLNTNSNTVGKNNNTVVNNNTSVGNKNNNRTEEDLAKVNTNNISSTRSAKNSRLNNTKTKVNSNNSTNNNTNATKISAEQQQDNNNTQTTEENKNTVATATNNSSNNNDVNNKNGDLELLSSSIDKNGNAINNIAKQEEQNLATTANKTTKKEHSSTVLKTIDASKTKLVEDPIFELKKLEIPEPYIRQFKVGALFSPTLDMNTSEGKGGIGYTFGLTVEADLFKKVSVKTGLIYAQKHYTARNEKIVDNTTTDGARHLVLVDKKTNLFILEIPLYAQYVFFQNDKWRVYATTGVSGNLIVGKDYTGTEKTEYNGVKMSTKINSQDYDEGLFKGGKFLDNVYMTVGGGIGIERQLGDQISLYLLPGYQHTLTPIGVNKDRINTFSLSVGIKTTIR